jgi:hypothetical protein
MVATRWRTEVKHVVKPTAQPRLSVPDNPYSP